MSTRAPSSRRAPRWFYAVLAAIVLVPFLAAEVALRRQGRLPAQDRFPNEPALLRPDPELGWLNQPGRYVFPGYSPEVEEITLTIDDRGRRATGASAGDRARRVALVGDSFTEGWAISDPDTFAWKLQRQYPNAAVENYGVGGYGAYQSLMMMRRLLSEERPPQIVLYGFVGDHGRRSVADPTWLRALTVRSRARVLVPYCTLDTAGRLVEHRPEPIPHWPLRDRLASVFALEQWWIGVGAAERMSQAEDVLRQLMREMQSAATAHGAQFRVVVLTAFPKQAGSFLSFLGSAGIPSIDCNRQLGPGRVVVAEGHPNEVVHGEWAECIGAALAPMLSGDARAATNG